MKKYIITIARGFGSGGKQIAMRLAEKLGIECYENRLLSMASQYSGLGEEYFQDEKLNGSYFVNKLMKMSISRNPLPVLSRFTSDPKMFDIQSHIIRALADTESCIIVGKCADYVLRDRAYVISVYIEAPRSYCVKRVMEKMPGVTEAQAHDMISKTDRYRADYYKYYTGGNNWTDVLNYDLTINTGKVGEDGAVDLILYYLKQKQSHEEGEK